MIGESMSKEVDILLAWLKKIDFGGHFFFQKRRPLHWRKLPTEIADFLKQTAEDSCLFSSAILKKSK